MSEENDIGITKEYLLKENKRLQAQNELLKKMLKQATSASSRYVELLAEMDELLTSRKNENEKLSKSLELQKANFVQLRTDIAESANIIKQENDEEKAKTAETGKTKRPYRFINRERSKRRMELEKLEGLQREDGLFYCESCDYKAKNVYALEVHNRQHTGEKPFECHLCDAKYSDPTNFRKHKQTHTAVRLYFCSICDKDYISSGSLKSHCLKHHDGEGFSLKRRHREIKSFDIELS